MLSAAIIDGLAQSALFHGLPGDALGDVAALVRPAHYQPGEMLIWQGEPSTTVYLITRGIAAVTRLASGSQAPTTLAYVMPGQSVGEVGILESQPRAASVVALTEVDVLVIQRHDFLEILQRHAPVAVALARLLGGYLADADRRQAQGCARSRLIILLDLGTAAATMLGHVLATALARTLAQPTAYTAFPNSEQLTAALELDRAPGTYHHPAGYDIVIPHADPALPAVVRATLLLDQIQGDYRTALIALPGASDAQTRVVLEHATHVIMVVPPTAAGQRQLRQVRAELTRSTASGRTGLSVVVVRAPGAGLEPAVDEADDALVVDAPLPSLRETDPLALLPDTAVQVIATLADRIDRTHQIAIYVPTTIAVDQAFDTMPYVARTLALLGARFGGATSTPAEGVWRSAMAGLVGEMVTIVQTYATDADLMRYLGEVVAYVRAIKHELQQEAMALEVDHQLMLI